MKLEDEISQRNFKDPYQKAGINLIFTFNWLMFNYERHFKSRDLTLQQFNVLRILRGQYPKPCNLKLVKERMLDRMSDVSRIVDKLVNKGYVERKECLSDRRNLDILLTEKGLAELAAMDFVDGEFNKLMSGLSEDEAKLLNDLLDKLRG